MNKQRYFWGVLAVVLTLLNLTSCFSDDDNKVVVSGDCIVTSITMGTLNRHLPIKTEDGKDSMYTVTVVGALYPMHIDHYRREIYNTDSLPMGTDVSKVVFSSFNASSSVTVRSIYSGQDTAFVFTDSLDCTADRLLTVHATNGTSQRSYTLRINVHREEGDSMRWTQMPAVPEAFAGVEAMRAISLDEKLYVLCEKEGANYLLQADADALSREGEHQPWAVLPTNTALQVASFVRFADAFYAIATDGRLMTSADGVQWNEVPTDFRPQQLVLAGSQHLVAFADGAFYTSVDAIAWQQNVADEPQRLPDGYVTGTCIRSSHNPTFETFVAVGVKDGKPCVWRKEIDLSNTQQFPWVYLPATIGSEHNIPDVVTFELHPYDGGTLLSSVDHQGRFRALAISYDNGRTWKNNVLTTPALPLSGCYAATVDHRNCIWLMAAPGGETWRGRINRLGWKNPKEVFDRAN